MGLEKQKDNRFDGQRVNAFTVIDFVSVNVLEDFVNVQGRTFVSQAAYRARREPIDRVNRVFHGVQSLLQALPSDVLTVAHEWLKTHPDFSGATTIPTPPQDPIPVPSGSIPDVALERRP